MYVRIQVIPGAKKEKWIMVNESTFSASVKEPAQRNLANRRVQELVALHFHIPTERVHIVSGHRSPLKVFDIAV